MLTLLLSAAHASPDYPGHLQTEQGVPCAPPCTLCHDSNLGGTGTVTSDFGQALLARGLTGGSSFDTLDAALTALADEGLDGDGDGTPDVDELLSGDDPNVDGGALCASPLPTPEYGCFNHARVAAGTLAVLLAAAAARRQR
jgi:hypothetical protein